MHLVPRPLAAKIRQAQNLPRSQEELRSFKLIFFVLLGLGFWALIYAFSAYGLTRALEIELFGEAITRKLLSFVTLIFLTILVISNIITAFSTYFLADDLQLLNTQPITHDVLFFSRFAETVASSSWMVVVFGAPVLLT